MTIRIRYAEWLLAAFLTFILVRTTPFTPRGLLETVADDAGGDIVKQIVTVSFAVVIGTVAMRMRGIASLKLPLPFLILLGFAATSLIWSDVPLIAGRRLALTVIVAMALMMAAAQLRPKTVLDIVRIVVVGLAFVSLLARVAYPQGALHLPSDPEPSVVGALRGVFYHKNLAGGVFGLAALLAAEALYRTRRVFWAGGLLVALAALILSRSTTSQLSVLVGIFMFLALRWSNILAENNASRALMLRMASIIGTVAILTGAWFATPLHDMALDPEAFSGRGQLWSVIGQLIGQRPMLGFGYQSVFQVGDAGPLFTQNLVEWIRHVPHSHNGLLDLLVTLGAVGSLIFFGAMFVDPWRRIASLPAPLRNAWQPLIGALLGYAATHSLMEGKIFSADSVEWTILVIVLGLSMRLNGIAQMLPPETMARPPITALWPDPSDQP